MKKVLFVMLMVVAMLTLGGCGRNSTSSYHVAHPDNTTKEPDIPDPVTGIDLATGKPGTVAGKVNGFWLPPEDFLTEEEKEFRNKVIETAGLDRDDPEFTEKLTALYIGETLEDYPNEATYNLFHN